MEEIIYYNSINKYLKKKFGTKVYKLSIDGGFTCPNRDGTLGDRGCIFCSGNGSGEFSGNKIRDRDKTILDAKDVTNEIKNLIEHNKRRNDNISVPSIDKVDYVYHDNGIRISYGQGLRKVLSISEQIKSGISYISKKCPKECKYIAYFQAYTSTYAPVEVLRKMYYEAILRDEIVGISIGTRPDCLSEEVLDLLEEINEIKPIFVELGLQTVNEATEQYIRRGYKLEVYDNAVCELKRRNIEVVTHVILGLPGENKEMMLDTVRHVVETGSKGIKLQLLHVIKGTDMAIDYENECFKTLSLEEYIDVLKDAIQLLDENMVVHRLTGDGDKRTLIAPLWSADKKTVLNEINKHFKPRE